MRVLRGVLLACALLSVLSIPQAWADDDPGYFLAVFWSLQPLPVAADESEHTVRPDEFLFQQGLRETQLAVLTNGGSVTIPAVLGGASEQLTFETNKQFFRVANVGGRLIFCAGDGWRSRRVLDGRAMRACLLDRDRDGVFDHVYWMGLQAGMTLWRDNHPEAEVSIPYQIQTDDQTPQIVVGPVVTHFFRNYSLMFAVRSRGEVDYLSPGAQQRSPRRSTDAENQDAFSVYFHAEDLPLTLTVASARIEISAVSDRAVTYRVLSPLDPSSQIAIDYNHSMPLPSERPVH